MQIGQYAYSCQFHPEVCSDTVDGWMTIPGIPGELEKLIGVDGLRFFKRNVAENMHSHNTAAAYLLDNWIRLVFR